jgi:AcrR family transcriptional regulator
VDVTIRPLPSPLRERVELAVAAFAEKGFEGTRMEDVAEVTGVSKATSPSPGCSPRGAPTGRSAG